MNNDPIFIIGCDRSGTSLLRRVLDAHRNIASPAETKFIYQLANVFNAEQSRNGLLSMGYSEEEILAEMKVFICRFLDGYAEKKGKARWAEKTPHNVYVLDLLYKIFKDRARYVILVRNGLDVAYSFTKVTHHEFTVIDKYRQDGVDTATAAIRHWREQNNRILDFMNKYKGSYHLIRYEDLTGNPKKYLNLLTDYLGEPWDTNMLNYNNVEHDTGYEDPKSASAKKIESNSGNYLKWDKAKYESLFSEAENTMTALGYTL